MPIFYNIYAHPFTEIVTENVRILQRKEANRESKRNDEINSIVSVCFVFKNNFLQNILNE